MIYVSVKTEKILGSTVGGGVNRVAFELVVRVKMKLAVYLDAPPVQFEAMRWLVTLSRVPQT